MFISYIDKKFYSKYKGYWDDKIFRSYIKKVITSDSIVLDYGCGRGNISEMNFHNDVKYVAGVDIGIEVHENPYISEGKQLDLDNFSIPYEDNYFDVVFSDNVMEHVANPDEVFSEINRILKPGGYFLSKTPNKYHYVALIASVTPNWFHIYYNKKRGRKEFDTFPTLYKCNSKKDVKSFSDKHGFTVSYTDLIEGRPEYLRLSSITYLLGLLYEKIVNSTKHLSFLRCVLIFQVQKT